MFCLMGILLVYLGFPFCEFLSVCFLFFALFCLFLKREKRKGMELGVLGGGEDPGGADRGERNNQNIFL